jgi:hypothetical protein
MFFDKRLGPVFYAFNVSLIVAPFTDLFTD